MRYISQNHRGTTFARLSLRPAVPPLACLFAHRRPPSTVRRRQLQERSLGDLAWGSSNTNANTSSGGGKDKDDETSPSFKEGKRVLAYHGPLLYEAKVRPYLPFHSNPT
uniref:Uncharacterized protein n=1 Tax=Oryza barthii TaxID=65489 RepID=A0A0D3FRR3_9ORYZ